MKYSKLEQIPSKLSHGKIEKKVMLKQGDASKLRMFNWAKVKPGESIESHEHENMYEIFYGLSGKLKFKVNRKIINFEKGDCLTLKPGEKHELSNPYKENAIFLCYGIAIDVDDIRF